MELTHGKYEPHKIEWTGEENALLDSCKTFYDLYTEGITGNDSETVSENLDDDIIELKHFSKKRGYVKFETLSIKGLEYLYSLPKFDLKKLH